jgi:hypothetical protein
MWENNIDFDCCHLVGYIAVKPYVNRRFEGAYHFHLQGKKIKKISVQVPA